MFQQKAVKHDAKLRLALCGPAGSGKTFSLLTIATELGGPIAYIDTEHGSASKYADLFDFFVEEPATFDPRQLLEFIDGAIAAGCRIVCIDSLSHYWMGVGGELELVDAAAAKTKGNSFAAWKTVTPMHTKLVDKIISAPIHVLVAMRTKTEWVIDTDANGKKVPRKIGLQPVMRDGIEFEFDVCGDLDQENTLTITKSRCSDLSGKVINRPGKEMAQTLKAWLTGAPKPEGQQDPVGDKPAAQGNGAVERKAAATIADDPDLAKLQAAMSDKKTIEATIDGLYALLCEKMGEDAALPCFADILAKHGAKAWQELGKIGKARDFVADLWDAVKRANVAKPEPVEELVNA